MLELYEMHRKVWPPCQICNHDLATFALRWVRPDLSHSHIAWVCFGCVTQAKEAGGGTTITVQAVLLQMFKLVQEGAKKCP